MAKAKAEGIKKAQIRKKNNPRPKSTNPTNPIKSTVTTITSFTDNMPLFILYPILRIQQFFSRKHGR